MPSEPAGGETSWERVKEIVADALEREPGERRAYVDSACGGDAALRVEVDSLLDDTDTSDRFLETPATALFEVPAPEPGARLGRYKLRSVIGEGGMGRVYEATQERPHRTVALKVLRPGFLAPDAERRFQWEVEALGRLNHPAIAQVHDAGVEAEEGGHALSWFAMERIDGRPLLDAADALRLDRHARLELFLRVAEGVAHAHQRGVIHRDLKPDNILVDDDGAPHLLDFGIARAADPLASSVTTAGEIVGTLAYMSPEQVLGEPDRVDARTDVYALGVLLYRLLTGVPPLELDGLSLPKAAMRLSQEDPRPAGDVDRSLRGDLETVLRTALARDAERRYATVDALAADVRRILANEPIAARPPSTWYQVSKFARRNRALVATASLAVLALVGAVIGTGVGLVRAESARERAVVDRDRAREANRFLEQILASASPDALGADVRVVDLLESAAAELDRPDGFEAAVRAGLHLTLGETYRRLGLPDEAETQLMLAIGIFEACDGEYAETTLEAYGALGEVAATHGDVDIVREALERVRTGLARSDDPPLWLRLRPLELEAAVADATGDLPAAVERSRAVFDAWREHFPEGDDHVETARTNLSTALLADGRGAEADALLARGIEVLGEALGEEHSKVLTMRTNRALALAERGERERALAMFAAIEPVALREWGPLHPKMLALRNNRATVLQDLGRMDEALLVFEEQVDVHLRLFGERHVETIVARNNLSVALMDVERYERATEVLRANLEALDGPIGEADPVMVVRAEMNYAAALSGLDRKDEALEVSGSVLERLGALVGPEHVQSLISRNNHAVLQMELGHTSEAVETARENLDLAREHHPDLPYLEFPFRMNLGRTLASDGRFEEAEAELLAVERHLASDPNTTPGQTARIREVLAETYAAWDRPEDAARWTDDG
ncbi:MAG: serine/threonine-protein kinase [Planctomycetota bacterium]